MKAVLAVLGAALALFTGQVFAACAGVGIAFHSEYCAESATLTGSQSGAQGGSGAALIGVAGQTSNASGNSSAIAGQGSIATPLGGATLGGSTANTSVSQGSASGALGLAAAGGVSGSQAGAAGFSQGAATGGILSIGGFTLP